MEGAMGCLRCNRPAHPESPAKLKEGWRCSVKDGLCLRINPKRWVQILGGVLCKALGHKRGDPMFCTRCFRLHDEWKPESR